MSSCDYNEILIIVRARNQTELIVATVCFFLFNLNLINTTTTQIFIENSTNIDE